jgi:putative hydrolase of the HAD superfamily
VALREFYGKGGDESTMRLDGATPASMRLTEGHFGLECPAGGSERVMKRLAAIFFDIDDTLYSTSEFARRARSNSIDAMIAAGVRLDRETLLADLDEVIAEFSSNYGNHFDKLLLRLPPSAVAGLNPAIVVASAVVAYHETKARELEPYPDAVELLSDLSRTGIIVGIVTAGLEIKQAEKIIRLRIRDYLTPNAIFISDQIGISKPNPKLYLRACQEVGVKPSEAMYVGDNPANDIDPVKSIGMVGVLNRRSGKYMTVAAKTTPDYQISEFTQLRQILRTDFGLAV